MASLTPIGDLLEGKTATERSAALGAEWAKVGKRAKQDVGDFEVEIVSVVQKSYGADVNARAWKDGVQVGFGPDGSVDIEHFRFVGSLPFRVPDGTKRTVDDGRGGTKEIDNVKEDVTAALLGELNSTIRAIPNLKPPNIEKGKVGTTVTTVYSEGDPETNVYDGVAAYVSGGATWANQMSGSGTGGNDANAASGLAGWQVYNTGTQFNWSIRGIIGFTNPSIPAGDTVSSVVVSIYGETKTDPQSNSPTIVMVNGVHASDTGKTNSDYENAGSDEWTSRMAYSSFTVGAYNAFTYNATGLAAFNKSSTNFTGWRTGHDLDVSAPTAANDSSYTSFDIYFADNGSNVPKMVITHSPGSGAILTPNKIW